MDSESDEGSGPVVEHWMMTEFPRVPYPTASSAMSWWWLQPAALPGSGTLASTVRRFESLGVSGVSDTVSVLAKEVAMQHPAAPCGEIVEIPSGAW